MKQERILIIDEEKIVCKTLKTFLIKLDYKNYFLIHELAEVKGTLKKVNFELIICKVDIQWGSSKKMQLKHALRNLNTKVIYLLPKGIDSSSIEEEFSNHYTFQTWPINSLSFRSIIEIYFKDRLRQKKKEFMIFYKGTEEHKIRFKEILWIQSEGNYCYIYTSNQKQVRRATIKQLLEILPMELFIQIHRSNVIQIEKIDHIHVKTKTIQLEGHTIPIGRKYRNALLERLNII